MPELPDVAVYVDSLERRTVGQQLERVRLISPFVLRTATTRRPSVLASGGTAVRSTKGLIGRTRSSCCPTVRRSRLST